MNKYLIPVAALAFSLLALYVTFQTYLDARASLQRSCAELAKYNYTPDTCK